MGRYKFKILSVPFFIVIISYLVFAEDKILSESPRRYRKDSIIKLDPNVHHDDEQGTTFNYIICKKWDYPLKYECRLFSTTRLPNNTLEYKSHCNFTLHGSDNKFFDKYLNVTSIRKINSDRVIIKWLEMQQKNIINVKYTILNNNDCSIDNLNLPIDLPSNPGLINDLFVNDKLIANISISSGSVCNTTGKCLIQYNIADKNIVKTFPLDINLMEASIFKGYGRSFYVQGRDPSTKSYRILYTDNYYAVSDLLTINSSVEIITSKIDINLGLTVCQIKSRTKNSTIINCLKYWSAGTPEVKNTFEIPDSVKLIDIKPLKRREQSISLLAEKINCEDQQCWELYIIIVNNGMTIIREVKFDCFGDRNNLIFHGQGSVTDWDINYGCEKFIGKDRMKSYFDVQSLKV